MSGVPGADKNRTVRHMLKKSASATEPIAWNTLDDREWIIAEGINQMLTALCAGRALNIIKGSPEPENG